MSLAMMEHLLYDANKNKRAVGAFNIANMEVLIGVIKAAEYLNTPVVIQIAEKRLTHSPWYLLGPMMVNASKKSKVDIAVQLDHGDSLNIIDEAIEYGFTSIMYDGSHLPIEENIKNTNMIYEHVKNKGVNLEAEIGVLSGNEGGGDMKEICTNPKEALHFYKNAKFDALAIAIGNAHGHYKGKPKLNFDVLTEIHNSIDSFLVLHGGTGISDDDFKKAISLGISKINIATANFDAIINASCDYFSKEKEYNYFALNEKIVEKVFEITTKHINIFNNK